MRSKLEEDVARQLDDNNIEYTYEDKNDKLKYTVPSMGHTYTPDFSIRTRSGKCLLIEAKGIWDYQDRYKHYLLRQQHPGREIRFIFGRSKSPIRKGSRTTYRDICEGRGRGIFKGIKWKYGDKGLIPPEWLEE